MIKLTVKQMKDNKNGYDIHLNADNSDTAEFIASIVSLIRGYQKYVEDNGGNISDSELLKQIKRVLKKGSKVEDMEVEKDD